MFALPLILLISTPTVAATKVIATQKEKFIPLALACEATQSCGLKHVTLQTKTKETAAFGDKMYSTEAQVIYETMPGVPIEDYVFVQMIKGCMYSRFDNGTHAFDVSREYWGKEGVTFQHRDWVIDNYDISPIFTSFGKHGPYALLRWNTDPTIVNPDEDNFYVKARPPHRTVYMADFPSQAYYSPGMAKQRISSLQFRTCLLHKDFVDLASPSDGSGVRFDKAVKCFDWSNNFAFSKTGKMTMPTTIDPICLGPAL